MNTNKQMLTVRELAGYLCVSESTIRKMVRESRIPFIKIISKILFNKSVIDSWIESNQVIPKE
ncbi:MAG: helix-turn-helix domain-containing protein [Bacilli bacterium]|nr:helix-turn-helix domain-containing protein [Bacilli bacterium]